MAVRAVLFKGQIQILWEVRRHHGLGPVVQRYRVAFSWVLRLAISENWNAKIPQWGWELDLHLG